MTNAIRYILTTRESLFWNHVNPDMRLWGMHCVFDVIDVLADEHGAEIVEIYDTDETYLATSRQGEEWDTIVEG